MKIIAVRALQRSFAALHGPCLPTVWWRYSCRSVGRYTISQPSVLGRLDTSILSWAHSI